MRYYELWDAAGWRQVARGVLPPEAGLKPYLPPDAIRYGPRVFLFHDRHSPVEGMGVDLVRYLEADQVSPPGCCSGHRTDLVTVFYYPVGIGFTSPVLVPPWPSPRAPDVLVMHGDVWRRRPGPAFSGTVEFLPVHSYTIPPEGEQTNRTHGKETAQDDSTKVRPE